MTELPIALTVVELAYNALHGLMEPGVKYEIRWDDADGQILKRFSRTLPMEAWLVAVPLDDEGNRTRDHEIVTCPICLDVRYVYDEGKATIEDTLRAKLDAIREAEEAA